MKPYKTLNSFGVVCHDAGGAGQIAAMLKMWNWQPAGVMVKGPAVEIWKHYFPSQRIANDLDEILQVAVMVTGTSLESDLEHQARFIAQKTGLRSVTVLDHWVNYKSRFVRHGCCVMPDEIWVVDEYAEVLAREEFPGMPIIRCPDCFAKDQLGEVVALTSQTPQRLLYMLEPTHSNWGKDEPGEFQALRYFFQKLPFLGLSGLKEVQLRPHPSEHAEKYDSFLNEGMGIPVRKGKGTLAKAISEACWVAGCQTYALTLALAAGRRVYSSLPPWAPVKGLPHAGIQYLREFNHH